MTTTSAQILPGISGGEHAKQLEWRPAFFRMSQEQDRIRMQELFRQGNPPQLFDTLTVQLRDLVRAREPAREIAAVELDDLTRDHLRGSPEDEYGVWVYYPWSRRLVHLLDEVEFTELRTDRNRYKITLEEQKRLATKRVGVVGLSVGQSIAITLALERSFGEIRLADFDRIDLSNLNRIRAGIHCVDIPKAYVTAQEIAEIDPFLHVAVFPEGITENNVDTFLLGGGKLDAIVEECDSIDIKVLLRVRAKQLGVPVVMATSDRGMLDIERFDEEPGRPIFHGLAGDPDPVVLRDLTADQKVPHVTRILGLASLSTRLRASFIEVQQTITTWPQLASSVVQGAGSAAEMVRRILLGERVASGRCFIDISSTDATEARAPVAHAILEDEPPCKDALIRNIVGHAVLAPSGGNSQPWRWVAVGNKIHLFLDPDRSSGQIDFEHRGSYLALGCAAENLILAAHHEGMEVQLDSFPPEHTTFHVATFRLLRSADARSEPHWRDDLFQQIALRHTNRKIGARQALCPDILAELTTAAQSIPSANVQWLTSDAELSPIAELIGITDRLRLLSPVTHRELFAELRWSRDEAVGTGDGIDIETLELSPSDRVGLEIARDWKVLELVRAWGGGRKLGELSRRLVSASSAVGLVVMGRSAPADYFNGGRAFQRLWLTATKHKLSVHPMTALPYFLARLKHERAKGLDLQMAKELARVRPHWEQLFPNDLEAGEVMLFRISAGVSTEKRSVRRPLDQVLTAYEAASASKE